MYEIGAKDIIEKILPVVDNFERGLACSDRKKTKRIHLSREWRRFTNN